MNPLLPPGLLLGSLWPQSLTGTPATGLVGALLFGGAGWLFWRRRALRLGLASLLEAAQRIADGERGVRLSSERADMLGALARELGRLGVRADEWQRALAAARDEGSAYALAKQRLFDGVSHELRTPMNCVIGMSSLLLDGEVDKVQRTQVQAIQSSARNLLGLLDDVLLLAQLESGSLELDSTSFALVPAVRGVVEEYAERARKKGLELHSHLEPGAPETVAGDELRLRQLLAKLLDNAIAFTDQGRVSLFMTCECFGADEVWLRFEVRDSGCGIQPLARERLFHPFEQADGSSTRRHGGAGLGLAICKRLVELMEGEIGFETEVGSGSCFHFSVIVKRPGGHALAQRQRSLESVPAALPAQPAERLERRARVLVVEDDEVNQRIMRLTLAKLGCDVDIAGNGTDALEVLEHNRFDLIFMDCQMPIMDGCQAARAIRSGQGCGSRVPIVAMTTSTLRAVSKQCLDSGMDDVISKPVETRALSRVLHRWAAGRTPASESAARDVSPGI